MIRKRRFRLIISIFLLISCIITGAYAWFVDSLTTHPIMMSHVQKSYFESGDGTSAAQFIDGTHGNDDSGCAFEIKYPIQLYYFAWLQALGYFNIPNEGQNSINQVYFYLSADLDMSGYVLPQIGTQEYPFVGNFDGNGHTISNLKVQDISQISSGDKWTDMPDGFTPANANIVGFFGVIGSLYTTGSNAGTVNGAVGTTSFTPTAGYTYSSQVNEAKNFALNNINITTQSNQALIGIAAGYVNGEMSNVQVVQSGSITKNGNVAALTSYTSNLSDYTLVGYVTDAFKDTSDVVFAKVDTPSEKNSQFNYASQGASAGWGGSIDMADMYNRILGILSQSNSNITYNTTEVRVYDESGNVISTQQGGSTATTAYRKYTAANDGSGNYMLTYRSDTKRFHYLTSLYKQVSIIKRTSATEAALYIKSGNTYLNINSNHNGISTNGNTTKWVLDSSGYLRTSDDSGMYYLNYSGTNFTLGTTGTTVWTRNGNTELQCSYGYIQLVNGAWTVRQDVERYYTIASGNNYLNATGTASLGTGNSVTGDTPTRWFFTNPGQGNSGTIYTIINGIRYYLLDATSNNGNLRLSNNQSNATSWYWTNSYLRAGNNGRYIYYNNSWFNSSWQGRINAQSLTITEHQPFEHSDIMLEDTTSSVYEYSTVTEPAEYGYMPLSAMQTYPYTVNTQNTGYIISGGYETSSYNADIRVSEYYKSDITTGLTAQTNAGVVKTSGVKTVDASGIHNINTANLVKYESSRKQFDAVLNGTTNVYGLHFMNSQISKDRLIVAPKVMIEGTQYTDYEMPEDSIDFNVHQKGYINFFAGTYFSGNNSFFSLHIIERDSNQKITAIKEIKEIWKSSDQSKEYIYYLKDGNNYEWSATKTSDYSLAFDTDWITHPGTNTQLGDTNLYYFEIPVNAGEFALGSVEGRTGAYLLYLDIAANAQRVYRATVIENFEETTNTYSFPVGVTFKNTIINPTSTETVIPSALAVMPTGTSSVNATVTDDTHITLSNGNVCYIADGVTVNNSLTYKDITTTPVASTTTRIRRTTYYDYNVAKNLYTVTVVEVRKVDDGAKSVTINAWNTGADWDIESNNATQIATMTTGFAPNIGSSTNNVAINTGEAQKLEYTAVDEIYCYLINVSSDDDAQTLRIDKNAFEGTLSVSNELYQFSYAIKDNDDETDGATIDYDYDFNLVMNADALDDNGLFAYSNRRYDISVDSNETIHTKVVTPVTNNNYNVTLTPTPN